MLVLDSLMCLQHSKCFCAFCIDAIQIRNAWITVVLVPSSFFAGLHFDFICAAPLKRSYKWGKVQLFNFPHCKWWLCMFKSKQSLFMLFQDFLKNIIPSSVKTGFRPDGDFAFETRVGHTFPQQMVSAFLLEDEKQKLWPHVMLDYMRHQFRFRGRTKKSSAKWFIMFSCVFLQNESVLILNVIKSFSISLEY